MNKSNFYYLCFFLISGLSIIGCGDNDDHSDEENQITISINEPSNGDTITTCSEVHLNVTVEASMENHELEIILYDDENNTIIEYDIHEHDQKIMFDQKIDLCSYSIGTCFRLEVVACEDHDCEETATDEVEFCLQ